MAYLGYDRSHWGHFLVNVVPRLWIALEHDSEIDEYVIVRDLGDSDLVLSENEAAFLRYLGILDKVRILTIPVKYSKVFVPEASYHVKNYIGKEMEHGEYFDEFMKVLHLVSERALKNCEIPKNQYKKVFFSRHDNPAGLDTGIELVDSFFWNNGYSILYPEDIPLAKLIYYLYHCEEVAYISGTLQHNMLFAPQGMKTVAVERRIKLTPHQTDIDMIKRIEATYVSTQYTILPGRQSETCIYAFNDCLQQFINKSGMNLPDDRFTNVCYLKKCVMNYLRRNVWSLEWETLSPSSIAKYYFEVLEDNIQECGRLIPELGLDEPENIKNPDYWKNKFQNLLISNNIPYSCWDENDIKRFIKTVWVLIEDALKRGKNKFLIYPYGTNGLIIENILLQRYGIHPEAVFDNKVSDYNVKVMKLDKIRDYLSAESCVILTTCIAECREELETYCERDMIVGPYTVF